MRAGGFGASDRDHGVDPSEGVGVEQLTGESSLGQIAQDGERVFDRSRFPFEPGSEHVDESSDSSLEAVVDARLRSEAVVRGAEYGLNSRGESGVVRIVGDGEAREQFESSTNVRLVGPVVVESGESLLDLRAGALRLPPLPGRDDDPAGHQQGQRENAGDEDDDQQRHQVANDPRPGSTPPNEARLAKTATAARYSS